MTPAPRPVAYYRAISKQRHFKGRRPNPTYQMAIANPRLAKANRALKKEFASQNASQ